MTGPKLYALYVEANIQNNCLVEEWASLTDEEKQIWYYMAERLEK